MTYIYDLMNKTEHCIQQNKHSYEAMKNLPKSTVLGHKVAFKIFQRNEIIQSMFSVHSSLRSKTTIGKKKN